MTPRRGLGVAAVVGVLLVLSGLQATVMALADQYGNKTFTGYTGLISPFTLVDGVVAGVFGADSSIGQGPPGTAGAGHLRGCRCAAGRWMLCESVARYRKAV